MEIRFLAGMSTFCLFVFGALIFGTSDNTTELRAFISDSKSNPRFFQELQGVMVAEQVEKLSSRLPSNGNRSPASVSASIEGAAPAVAPASPESMKKWLQSAYEPESRNALMEQFMGNSSGVREALVDGLQSPDTRFQAIEVLGLWVGSEPNPERLRWLNSEMLKLDLTDG
ncbi:MAG: hypothetical protein KGP28_06625, partial [Bdellovibrionales bacterium]|nr:hypothetical protein [Bdellovibrionales bacterium]